MAAPPTGKFGDDGAAPGGAPAPVTPEAMPPSPPVMAPQGAPYYPPPGPPSYPPAPAWTPAPPPPTAEAAPPVPDWSLGVGLVSTLSESAGGVSGFSYSISPSLPSYALSLERRLAGRTWLIASGVLSYTTGDQTVTPRTTTGTSSTSTARQSLTLTTAREAILLAVRQVLAQSVVDVAAHAGLGFAHAGYGGDDPRPNEQVNAYPGEGSNLFLVFAGFSVERELVRQLSVRLNADVAQLSYMRSHGLVQDPSAESGLRSTKLGTTAMSLFLRPGLFLQFYF